MSRVLSSIFFDEIIKSKKGKVEIVETDEQWFGLIYKENKAIVREQLLQLMAKGKYLSKFGRVEGVFNKKLLK